MLNIMAWWIGQNQFVMGSSGHMVALWPVVKHLLSTEAQEQAKSCISEESNYIKR